MREILFRAKKVDDKEWVQGGYVNALQTDRGVGFDRDAHFIIEHNGLANVVDPKTVCQYTGLTDRNGRKIFERDIVKAKISINDFARDSVKNEENIYEVSYHEKYCYFYIKRKNNNLLFDGNWSYYLKEIEVVGNIFDNPELIGEQP